MRRVTVLVVSVSHSVCLSVCQLTTKRGIGIGSVAFSDGILLKSLSTKHEAREVRFSQTNVKTIPDLPVWTKVPAGVYACVVMYV